MGAGLSAPSRAKVHDRTPAGHCQVKRVTSAVPGLHPQTNCPFGLGVDRGLARRALQLPSSSFLASAFRLPDGESSPRTRNLSLQLCASFLPGGPRSPGLQPLPEHVPLYLAPAVWPPCCYLLGAENPDLRGPLGGGPFLCGPGAWILPTLASLFPTARE